MKNFKRNGIEYEEHSSWYMVRKGNLKGEIG